MNVLLIGSGGREHALAWKLRQSKQLDRLYAAPGNAGIATLPDTELVNINAIDNAALLDFAQKNQIDLTIVGPEVPLAAGIVDLFQAAGLRIFGPSQAAAQLESSKAFSKRFMKKYGIPTARAEIFTDFDEAVRYLRPLTAVPVIKASGLAAGKGVIVASDMEEAAQALQAILLDRQFGEAGDTVLIEDRLSGPELSLLAFCDGKSARLMPAAQDHKRLFDRERGPNTGGMGAFAPTQSATPELLALVEKDVILPTLAGMAAEGTPFVGVLFVGLMLTATGPKVLEFNTRFGDPETQVIMPLLQNDLITVINACIDGTLDQINLQWRRHASVTVVMAAHGYPGEYPTGHPILGLEKASAAGCLVFHAGTKFRDARFLTNGGRVLSVTATGKTMAEAVKTAYDGVTTITFAGAHFRNDIGRKPPENTERETQKLVSRDIRRTTARAQQKSDKSSTRRIVTQGKMKLIRRRRPSA